MLIANKHASRQPEVRVQVLDSFLRQRCVVRLLGSATLSAQKVHRCGLESLRKVHIMCPSQLSLKVRVPILPLSLHCPKQPNQITLVAVRCTWC